MKKEPDAICLRCGDEPAVHVSVHITPLVDELDASKGDACFCKKCLRRWVLDGAENFAEQGPHGVSLLSMLNGEQGRYEAEGFAHVRLSPGRHLRLYGHAAGAAGAANLLVRAADAVKKDERLPPHLAVIITDPAHP